MSLIKGTNVAAPIAPFTTDDTFPTHDSQYGKGGFREVVLMTDRDAIPDPRRSIGMIVYVAETGNNYQLIGGITNANWTIFIGGGGGSTSSFKHIQSTASDLWVIQHNLGKFPSVTITDSLIDKQQVYGKVNFIDLNTVTIEFSGAMTGEAYLV